MNNSMVPKSHFCVLPNVATAPVGRFVGRGPHWLMLPLLLMLVAMGCQTEVADPQSDQIATSSAKLDSTGIEEPVSENQAETENQAEIPAPSSTGNDPASESQAEPLEFLRKVALFDGRSLDGWEVTNFGGEGDCTVEDGVIVIEAGYPISGITSTREDLPTSNYEISLEARKTDGFDFFCGLTFPVHDSHCTFVVGGWAGAVVGLSCIDDQDASMNETRKLMDFDDNQWYRIKVRVLPKKILAWIDDELIVDFVTEGRRISLRNETLPSRPLGICNFETTSELKNIELTHLKPNSESAE